MCPLLVSNPLTPAGHWATSPPNPPWVSCCFSHLLLGLSLLGSSVPGTSPLGGAGLGHRELSLGAWDWEEGDKGFQATSP